MLHLTHSHLRVGTLFVKTNDKCANKYTVSRGVPHGGVLSRTIFNLALISVANVKPAHVVETSYADDICLWTNNGQRNVPPRRLQKALHLVSQQLFQLGPTLSAKKTNTTAFTRTSMRTLWNYHILLGGHPLLYVNSCKYLGIIIVRSLTWASDTNRIKIDVVIGVLRCLVGTAWGCSCYALLALERCLAEGTLRYSAPIRRSASDTTMKKNYKLHRHLH